MFILTLNLFLVYSKYPLFCVAKLQVLCYNFLAQLDILINFLNRTTKAFVLFFRAVVTLCFFHYSKITLLPSYIFPYHDSCEYAILKYMDVLCLLPCATSNSVSGFRIEFVGIIISEPTHILGYFSLEVTVYSPLCTVFVVDFLPASLISISLFV